MHEPYKDPAAYDENCQYGEEVMTDQVFHDEPNCTVGRDDGKSRTDWRSGDGGTQCQVSS